MTATDPSLTALRSVHTPNFPDLLDRLGISLLVTTYQAGKLVMIRADQGRIGTRFRSFSKPMGLAVDLERGAGRLAIGTALEVWCFQNVPAVAAKRDPEGRCDACYLPLGSHTTGDVQIHEMAWSGDELYFVNTRFSCLCTVGGLYQFMPYWKPPFVTALAPEDRCHLNGLSLVEGRPRYVTALGETDTRGGWRQDKKQGGVLLEVPSGAVLVRGLSMPHSPRWHGGLLWLLESGTGSIGTVDLGAGHYQPVAELPGFTRGLDFYGDLAFVGLSKVRETAVFSGIPLTERPNERVCGVWVLDCRTGQTVALLRFEEAVQEIFAVQVLPGIRSPDVVNDDRELIANSFVLPEDALKNVAGPYR